MIVFWMHNQYQCCCEKNVQYLNNSYFIYFSKSVMKVLFCFIRGLHYEEVNDNVLVPMFPVLSSS